MNILKQLGWYNIYRWRIITENNWKNSDSNTTYIKLTSDQHTNESNQKFSIHCDPTTGAIIRQYFDWNYILSYNCYSLKLSAHPDLKQNNGKEQYTSISTVVNTVLLERDAGIYITILMLI